MAQRLLGHSGPYLPRRSWLSWRRVSPMAQRPVNAIQAMTIQPDRRHRLIRRPSPRLKDHGDQIPARRRIPRPLFDLCVSLSLSLSLSLSPCIYLSICCSVSLSLSRQQERAVKGPPQTVRALTGPPDVPQAPSSVPCPTCRKRPLAHAPPPPCIERTATTTAAQ